jgi:hypothetical protein
VSNSHAINLFNQVINAYNKHVSSNPDGRFVEIVQLDSTRDVDSVVNMYNRVTELSALTRCIMITIKFDELQHNQAIVKTDLIEIYKELTKNP